MASLGQGFLKFRQYRSPSTFGLNRCRWRRHGPSKCRAPIAQQYGVTSHNIMPQRRPHSWQQFYRMAKGYGLVVRTWVQI